MVVKVNRPVLREQRVEAVVVERVWVRAFLAEDHQVGDVDDAEAEGGAELAEEGGGGDDLEGDFDADAAEDAGVVSVTICGHA